MRLFTSESVLPGHPDKVCDRISDVILDAYLTDDPDAHVAVETMATASGVIIAGEVSSTATIDRADVVRAVYRAVYGLEPDVDDRVIAQSPEIAAGVRNSYEARHGIDVDDDDLQGAGDQGIMFGYATDETAALMPLPIVLAHQIAEVLAYARRMHPWLGPDGKTQVTAEVDDNGRVIQIRGVLVSIQHTDEVTLPDVGAAVRAAVLLKLAQYGIRYAVDITVNPAGPFTIGGPAADTGLTGRKIIVDTYGGAARHGGGAFSGKDPSKVDRSGAYAARWVARHLVAAGLAHDAEVQLAYTIGQAEPTSVHVHTNGTGTVPDHILTDAVRAVFDLRPAAIIRDLRLNEPMYAPLATYGHMGRPGYPWETTNPERVEQLHNTITMLTVTT